MKAETTSDAVRAVGYYGQRAFRLAAVLAMHAEQSSCSVVDEPRGARELLWDTANAARPDPAAVCAKLADAEGSETACLELVTSCPKGSDEDKAARQSAAMDTAARLFSWAYEPSGLLRETADTLYTWAGKWASPCFLPYPAFALDNVEEADTAPWHSSGSALLALWFLTQRYDTRFVFGLQSLRGASGVVELSTSGLDAGGAKETKSLKLYVASLGCSLLIPEDERRKQLSGKTLDQPGRVRVDVMFSLVESLSSRGVPIKDVLESFTGITGIWTS